MTRPHDPGSAHNGLGEWLLQRISALYIAGFLIYLAIWFTLYPVNNYQAWLQWFGSGVVRASFGVFIISLVAHAWVGMRSVYMDYVPIFWLRFVVSSATAIGLMVLLLWFARILLETRIP
ncbi:MAG: succinate dehydrogenase, hydrophobic membrane anchor protein [Proteobacteria bacterium]|nr:succinate dehydrogenase, hydrophobic membrane anchor protein [Pseudomonadota bacterium]